MTQDSNNDIIVTVEFQQLLIDEKDTGVVTLTMHGRVLTQHKFLLGSSHLRDNLSAALIGLNKVIELDLERLAVKFVGFNGLANMSLAGGNAEPITPYTEEIQRLIKEFNIKIIV